MTTQEKVELIITKTHTMESADYTGVNGKDLAVLDMNDLRNMLGDVLEEIEDASQLISELISCKFKV